MFNIKDYAEAENFRSSRYSEIVRHFCGIKEDEKLRYGPKGKRIKEQLVKCIWSGQYFKKENLYTVDGSRLEVISPGYWNVEEGPDFKGAEILLEGRGVVKGDVEIHVYSQDWISHGHHKQEEYENVCLHVFMWNNNKNEFIKLKNGYVPQLELYSYLEFEVDRLIEMIDVEEYPHSAGANVGPCQKGLSSISDDKWIGYFLDFAGDERILIKTSIFEKQLKTQTFEQILYQAIMESLGYKNNKEQFQHLASIVSVNDIRSLIPLDVSINQRNKTIQALLFGMAGLLPNQLSSYKNMDKHSLKYVKEIEGLWSTIKDNIKNKPINGELWCFKYTRPGNFPTRRIAAISSLLAENFEEGIFRIILKSFERVDGNANEVEQTKIIIKNIETVFMKLYDEYWSYYYTFGGKRLKNRERLIGRERENIIFINIIIPVLLAYARKRDDSILEDRLFKVYRQHPKLSPNNVTRFMSCRIFGQDIRKRKVINNARRQQGLLQIFKDFCESDDIACKRCALLLSINSLLDKQG
ncbi:MAG: DUF2851 family protein [Candidatus Scalinduaceae bacterium]